MKTRKKICGKIFKRYQKAGKKGKAKILDGYAPLLEYNRDYLARLLTNWGKTRYAVLKGNPVKFTAEPAVKGRQKAPAGTKTGRPEKYHKAFVRALTDIWELFDFLCGKLLAPLIKGTVAFLVLEFNLSEELRGLLQSASPATIDRKLKKEKLRFRLKGVRAAKPGSLLKSQIPVRVCFDWGERRPGFFELDTVSHCGANASGQVLPDFDRH
jgi:hypothetical protein